MLQLCSHCCLSAFGHDNPLLRCKSINGISFLKELTRQSRQLWFWYNSGLFLPQQRQTFSPCLFSLTPVSVFSFSSGDGAILLIILLAFFLYLLCIYWRFRINKSWYKPEPHLKRLVSSSKQRLENVLERTLIQLNQQAFCWSKKK